MKYLRIIIPAILVVGLVLGKIYYDTFTLEVRHYRIVHTRLAETLGGAKVAFLSDLHMKRFGPREKEVLRILEEERPDLILFGGDYIAFQGSFDPVRAFFREVPRAYAVMGNSDYYNENGSCILCHRPQSRELTPDPRVSFLRNSSIVLKMAGGKVNLIGLDDPVKKKSMIAEAMRGIDSSAPSILIAHSPDIFEEASFRGIDIVLAGHNHGGQVYPARFLRGRMLIDASFEYLDGFFQKGRTLMFVSKGVGTSYLPFRLGVRPEVTFFRFVGDNGNQSAAASEVVLTAEGKRSPTLSLADLAVLANLSGSEQDHNQEIHRIDTAGKLFDFESDDELQYLNWECRKWFERSTDHATSGRCSLAVTLPPGQYPGINFIDIEKDWSAYRLFKLDVFNPDAESLQFHIRIDDRKSGLEYGNRFDRDFVLPRGMNHITLPLADVRANIALRTLDLRQVERLMFFIPGNDRKRTFYIDNIRLE